MSNLLPVLRDLVEQHKGDAVLAQAATGGKVEVMSRPMFNTDHLTLIRIAQEEKPMTLHSWKDDTGQLTLCLTTYSPFVTIYSKVK